MSAERSPEPRRCPTCGGTARECGSFAYRLMADAAWERGNKEASTNFHQQARDAKHAPPSPREG